ncbi:MAG: FAD-dependent oxidoreductase [Phascolarctobacterium sp.]|nr:FAD-dependent oxidoreductase [Phascolarctobacterium sp.]
MSLLLQPARLGRLKLKNRAVMSPMVINQALRDGSPSEAVIKYYSERARGGIGLIIVEGTDIARTHCNSGPNRLALADKINLVAFEKLVRGVHAYGTKIVLQMIHPGAASGPMPDGSKPWGVSEIPFVSVTQPPHAMTTEEVHVVIQEFVDCALRAKQAGFDGVELHAAHAYLLGEFLAPYYNNRTDCYGGSFENRLRIFSEIYQAVRKAVGPAYLVGIRFSGDEMTPHVSGTLNKEDGIAIAKEFAAIGFDYINVSNGNAFNANANCDPYSYQPGWKKHVAADIKAAVNVPIIATNTVKDPEWAEQLLQENVCDFVALGRSQFADPEFMNKTQATGMPLRKCIGCMHCRERLIGGLSVHCTVNPRMGRETEYPSLTKNGNKRPVCVVGAGPAGMQAAITLAERNFAVTLLEKDDKLGGTLNLAEKPSFKEKLTGLKECMIAELKQAGVQIKTNTSVTASMLKDLQPEGVFLACGSKPIVPPLKGINSPKVILAEDVIRTSCQNISGKVAVVGSGLTGLETAELLAEHGCEVAVYEMQGAIAPGLFPVIKNDIVNRLEKLGVALNTNTALAEVTETGIIVKKENGSAAIDCDKIVLALGVRPNTKLADELETEGMRVFELGDCSKAGRITEAILDGFNYAYHFEEE